MDAHANAISETMTPPHMHPRHAAFPRHARREGAERIAERAHQHRERRKERDVLLAVAAPLEVVAAHRDAAVPPGVEASHQIERGIRRQREAHLLVQADRDDRQEPDDEHGDARQQRAAGDA